MTHLIYSALPRPRRDIVFVGPSLSVKACASLMTTQNIGALLVRLDENLKDNRILGMVTEREIVRGCVHPGLDPNQLSAADIAYQDISILSPNDPLETAMETITQTKRRHILIQDGEELVAILSIGDVLFHLLDDKARVIEHLQNYINS